MADWSSLHEFHADPVRFTHVSWLNHYPASLVKECMESTVCRRLLTKNLLDMYPYPQPQDFDVPEELAWALADADQLRDLAACVGTLVFAPWIRRVISRSRIEVITHAIGSEKFLYALECSEPIGFEGDVVDVISCIHDEAVMREFVIDVGWTCVLQLLTGWHAHLAWRFRLLGRNPQMYTPSAWQIRCDCSALLQRMPELTGRGVSA
jgi:hypothetical protein